MPEDAPRRASIIEAALKVGGLTFLSAAAFCLGLDAGLAAVGVALLGVAYLP